MRFAPARRTNSAIRPVPALAVGAAPDVRTRRTPKSRNTSRAASGSAQTSMARWNVNSFATSTSAAVAALSTIPSAVSTPDTTPAAPSSTACAASATIAPISVAV
ncbi:MAG TPA: hypothetical protein VGD84_22140 [Pseudonocardiaceae bacterium]